MKVVDFKTPQPMRAVVYGGKGRYELQILDLTDLCRQAIERGLVTVK